MRRLLAAAVLLLALAPGVDARTWGWLGVRIRDLSEQEMDEISKRHGLREGYGVMIVEVMEDTPAARSGMRSGDVVVAFEGRPVTDTRMLQRLVAAAPLDRDSRLTVLRNEGRRPIPVRLAVMPRDVTGERVAVEFGFLLRQPETVELPARVAAEAAGPAAVGVVVRASPAERAGLRVGDVVVEVNGRAVDTIAAARDTLADIPVDRPLLLALRRGDERVVVTLPPPEGGR